MNKKEKIGTWAVNYYGANKYSIEETIGPGLAKLVKVFPDLRQAKEEAAKHNKSFLIADEVAPVECFSCGGHGHSSTQCLWN